MSYARTFNPKSLRPNLMPLVNVPNAINLAISPGVYALYVASGLGKIMTSCQNGNVYNPFQQEAKDGPHYPRNSASVQGRCGEGNRGANDSQDLRFLGIRLP